MNPATPESRSFGPRRRAWRGSRRTGLLLAVAGLLGNWACAAAQLPPQFGERAARQYQAYRLAEPPKAFAVASDGAWAWVANQPDRLEAEQAAVERCTGYSNQRCLILDSDDQSRLDPQAWHASWGPYPDPEAAAGRRTGVRPGFRFPDLAFGDRDGTRSSLGDLRGEVVLVHFWGSWCPPCMGEFPSLQRLVQRLRETAGVRVILLQVREGFADSLAWARTHGFDDMPLYDSGVGGSDEAQLSLVGGGRIADRYLSRAFPGSYVLDRNGVVVFARMGAVEDWESYLPFFDHLLGQPSHRDQAAADLDPASD